MSDDWGAIPDIYRDTYQEYLKSEHWLTLRNIKLHEAANKCQICCSNQHLQIHHNTYERMGHELLSDLFVLCDQCHAKFHGEAE